MSSESDWNSADDGFCTKSRRTRKLKQRKVTTRKGRTKAIDITTQEPNLKPIIFDHLLQTLHEQTAHLRGDDSDICEAFEDILVPLLPELLDTEGVFSQQCGETSKTKTSGLHLLSSLEAHTLHDNLVQSAGGDASILTFLLATKARLHSRLLRRVVLNRIPSYLRPGSLTLLPTTRITSTANAQVIDALHAIRTTPYENSFLFRIEGPQSSRQNAVLIVDWETRTAWMELMSDIRVHYSLAHPDRVQVEEVLAPITYCILQSCHLDQVHDLLARAFWDGINVSDSLDYNPEKCTIVATYKQLVVGAALLSSPQQTYITYLAVRSGWDNSQIATSMLYHLITLNPHKDITLHVSINNPAMLLYNRFGFKAEEFIVGFYEDYLDPNSPQSKNAFRLRLRRW